MSSIHSYGEWDELQVTGRAALTLTLVSHVPATLTATGTTTTPKYLGAARHALAFPVSAVAAEQPVTVRAVTGNQEPFPGDCVVDLSVDAGSGSGYLLRGLPVTGQVEAPLVRLRRTERGLVLVPGAEGQAALSLGGWCVKRCEENGQALRPTVSTMMLDTSSSMRRHSQDVAALTQWLDDVYAALGVEAPQVVEQEVGGARAHGVGYVGGARSREEGRTVVVTDMPLLEDDGESLVVGPPELAELLPTGRTFVPTREVWDELHRDDTAFTQNTLRVLTPLLEWVSLPADTNGESE